MYSYFNINCFNGWLSFQIYPRFWFLKVYIGCVKICMYLQRALGSIVLLIFSAGNVELNCFQDMYVVDRLINTV